ncbi:MAG: hypothetical protein KDK53_16475 [Maritimibacter sp.]|nr:hypothetical protein [Maritimibacter sp.]
MTRATLIACLVLAGCGGAPLFDRAPATEAPRGISLETDDAGLRITGGGAGRIDFGRSPAGVIPLLERELGPGRELDLVNCPYGVTQQIAWGDLVLTFTDEQFVGWRGAAGSAGQTCGRMA